jgi:toxin YoeB
MKKGILFHANSLEEFLEWQKINKKIFDKITKLLKEIQRTPFEGTGNPEQLRHELNNCWSRRIDLEHRLVYEIKDEYIIIYSCKGHY